MIVIFIGPPFSGKGTQAQLLGEKLNLPVFSMGNLIREAYVEGDPKAKEGFEKYSMKGLHLPIGLKFHLLKKEMDQSENNFILDNFPANQEDLNTLLSYLSLHNSRVDKVFYISVSEEEMEKREASRGRRDDDPEVLKKRRRIQDSDRMAVIKYFRGKGILEEINGEQTIEEIEQQILEKLEA